MNQDYDNGITAFIVVTICTTIAFIILTLVKEFGYRSQLNQYRQKFGEINT